MFERAGVCFVRGLGAGRVFMAVFVFLARVSKIAFGSMVWLSFRCLLAADSVWM